MASSATCAALGSAFGELGSFEEALSYYQRSRALSPSDASVESLEHLVNLSGRLALELFSDMLGTRAADAPREVHVEAQRLFAEAEKILDALLVLSETSDGILQPPPQRTCLYAFLQERRGCSPRGRKRQSKLRSSSE